MALGDDTANAIGRAHEYIHSQVVYAVENDTRQYRPADIYNELMTLLAAHYREAHDVAFYADKLAITPRYLNAVTRRMVDKSSKEVISGYLLREALALLTTSRLTIGEVAARLGFSSPASFTKWFTANEGAPPMASRINERMKE